MNQVTKRLRQMGIVPVVVLDDAKDAIPLAEALCEGGLPCAEVTFRTDAAEDAIRLITKKYPDMMVGAGTILTTEQADRALAAGAGFIVSPGLNPRLVTYCMEKGVTVIPGISDPGGIEQALELGLDTVKFFPAEAAGGIAMIKAIAAPYSNITFMPTGGISSKNLRDYLDFPGVLACGGSWMVKSDLIRDGQFEQIKKLTQEAVQAMLGFELVHIGINCRDNEEALRTAGQFSRLLGMPEKEGNSSIFTGTGIEVMKKDGRGSHGHIGIGTHDLTRAVFHLEKQGYSFDPSSAKYKNGKITALYLQEEIGGFAVHLLQK